jgi:hypothetical protein
MPHCATLASAASIAFLVLPDQCGHRQMRARTVAGADRCMHRQRQTQSDRCGHRQSTVVQLLVSVKQAVDTHSDSDTCPLARSLRRLACIQCTWLLSSDILPHLSSSRKYEEACLLQIYPRRGTWQVAPGFSVQTHHKTNHALQPLDGMHAAQHQLQPETG